MRRLLACAFCLTLFASSAGAGEKAKTIKLFNGKNLDGWTYHLRDDSAKMEDVWSVSEGVIHCQGRPAGYIRTEDKYTNYTLTLEWRFSPEQAGNSGVLLRMVGEDKVWPKSVEAQLMSGNAGDIWNIDNFPAKVDESRTQGRRTVKLKESSEKPLGQWNKYRIELHGGDLKLYVNDVLQNTATQVEEVAGHICLQSEGVPIEFRNIELTPGDK